MNQVSPSLRPDLGSPRPPEARCLCWCSGPQGSSRGVTRCQVGGRTLPHPSPPLSADSDPTLAVRSHFTSTVKRSKRKRRRSFSQSILEPARVVSLDSRQKFTLLMMRQWPQGSVFRAYACPSTGASVNRGLTAPLPREAEALVFLRAVGSLESWDRKGGLPSL